MKYVILATALLVPQMVGAADLTSRRYQPHVQEHRYVERNHVFTCTTSSFLLFSYSNCGQGLDPLAFAGN